MYLAASNEVKGVTGKQLLRNRDVESSAASHDREDARRLWDLSVELTDLKRHAASNSWPF